jgi:hypothetical protein
MKTNGCIGCHQLGQLSTRTFPKNVPHPFGPFATSQEAWFRRIQSGQSGEQMFTTLVKDFGGAPVRYLADWTDHIAKGELPHAKPPRPQGVERNIVLTTWDWLDDKRYLHDLIASDRRYPTVNAYGPVYGSTELSVDIIPILDPKAHTVTNFPTPMRDADTPASMEEKPMQPSPYWSNEQIWTPKQTTTTACLIAGGACSSPGRCVVRIIRPSARKARTILPPKLVRWSARTDTSDARSQDHEVHVH